MRPLYLAAAAALSIACGAASAQDFPSQRVSLVVPYPAGATANDVIGRFIAEELGKHWGKQVAIENRAGANGAIGASYVTRAAADGHTLLFSSGAYTMTAALEPNLPFDAAKDLVPAAIIATGQYVLVIGNHVPATNVAEFITAAKARQMIWASTGAGAEFGARLFIEATGLNMKRVPYRGTNDALPELLGGRIDFMVSTVAAMQPYIVDKKVKPLAMTGEVRSKVLTDIPTLAEQGVTGANLNAWWGIFVSSKTPAPIIEKINKAVLDVLAKNDAKDFLSKQDAVPTPITNAQASKLVGEELDKFKALAVKHNIKVE